VDVRWTDNAGDETGFTVQRSTDGGQTWADVASVGANVTTYRDAGVAGGTAYAYRVRAFDATRVSGWSNVASVTTPAQATVPAAPSNLSARALSTTSVRLTWADNSTNETGFHVYGSKDGGTTWQLLGSVGANVTAADHTRLKRNQTWTYVVKAYNAAGESVSSNVASASTALSPALALPGDANLDGSVNFNDLLVLARNYNPSVAGGWAAGDFTGDGVVNFSDLLALSRNYNVTQSTGELADTPEWGVLTEVAADGQAVAALVAGTTAKTSPAQVKAKLHAITAKRPAGVFSVRSIAAAGAVAGH
jgi:titin